MPVITPLETSFGPGLIPGSAITVQPGTVAVFILKGKATDVLPEGVHSIDAATLPNLAKITKLQAFGDRRPLEATGYMVSMEPVTITWESGVVLSQNRTHGLTFSAIGGRTTFRVTNPGAFVTSMFSEASELGKARGDKLSRLFPTFMSGRATKYSAQFAQQRLPELGEMLVKAWTEILAFQTVGKLRLDPSTVQTSAERLRLACGQNVEQWLTRRGAALTGFSVDNVAPARRSPCVVCGSDTAPTGFATFKRNISLFVIRFETKREGNFCVTCAFKTSAVMNLTMLVAGYWGYIGLILSPIYFVSNIINFFGVVFGPKLAANAPQANDGMWPPAPRDQLTSRPPEGEAAQDAGYAPTPSEVEEP